MVTYPTSIRRVIIIALENKSRSTWIADSYIGSLASKYGDATNFHGFSAISLPDYLLETSGSNQGVTGDSFTFCQFKVNNIYDVLTANGIPFENFEEKTGSQGNHRHVPGYFYPISCKGVQDMSLFMSKYVNGNQIPTTYTWVTPNMCNCGHDCPVSTVSAWLKNTLKLDTILSKPWFTDGSTLIILVCDDGGSASTATLCLMMSTSSRGIKSNVSYKHVNDLSTVMWLLGITGSIGNASASIAMKDLFGSTPPQVLTSIEVAPTSVSVGIGSTAQLTAICKDHNGSAMTCPALTWSSSDNTIATVDSKGIVTGISIGTVDITTTSGTITSNKSTITIVATPPPTEKIVVTNPIAGKIWKIGTGHVIRWTHTAKSGSLVKIELLKTNKVIITISSSTANDDQFAWTVPKITTGTDYQIKITSKSNNAIFGISGNFTIQ
jgi:hypothetical protein